MRSLSYVRSGSRDCQQALFPFPLLPFEGHQECTLLASHNNRLFGLEVLRPSYCSDHLTSSAILLLSPSDFSDLLARHNDFNHCFNEQCPPCTPDENHSSLLSIWLQGHLSLGISYSYKVQGNYYL